MGSSERISAHPLTGKASLSAIRRLVRKELQEVGADPADAFDCLVALSEACTYALTHESPEPAESTPAVSWEIDPATARFRVVDFCLHEAECKIVHPSRGPEAVEEGTLGLLLMRGLMDRVDIRPGRRGAAVDLVKRLG